METAARSTAPENEVGTALQRPLEITLEQQTGVPPTRGGGMDDLIALALREKSPVEALERLVALKEREDAKMAARLFYEAKAAVQAEVGQIKKEGKVDYASSGGQAVKFSYAMLDDIDAHVRPLCNKRGLSYSWNSKPEAALVTTECVLRHIGGHSESSFFSCPTTSKAGMSDQQKYGAAVKYSMRWSLILALGLITTDDDVDVAEVDPTPIDEAQRIALEDLLEEAKKRWKGPVKATAKWLKFLGVAKLADIRKADFERAAEALRPKAAE